MAKRLIIFIHGLGGASEATWRHPGRPGFPELIRNDRALRSACDIAFFEFPTSLFRLPFSTKTPRVRDLAEGLRSQIDVRYPNYDSIALVCHSLGGLIARKYLVEEVKRGSNLRVDKLLLFAVPNNGAALASVARHVSWHNSQLSQLCRNSELIEELNTDWSNLDMSRVDVRYVVAAQDDVVDKQSAVNQWGNTKVDSILDAGHVSIVKPQSPTDLAFLILRRFVLGPAPVFVSVGGGRTKEQDSFVTAVKKFLRSKELDGRTVDEYGPKNKRPLMDVEDRMRGCYGAVILAFERTYIEQGVSRRGTEKEVPLKELRLPPVWNHIEAAMAYTLGLPLLVLAERGLIFEGLLEDKYDWRMKQFNLRDTVVEDPEFLGIFDDWRNSVLKFRDAPSSER
jgi:predicted alpha/beta hydrolase family esterase